MSNISKVRALIEAIQLINCEFTDEEVGNMAIIVYNAMERLDIEKAPTDGNQ